MSIFLLWVHLQISTLANQIIDFDRSISRNPHLQTAFYVLTENQRFYQLEYGIKPKPMKRKKREIMALWLLSFTQDYPTDSPYFTHP